MRISQADMDFDGLHEDKPLPPGGVYTNSGEPMTELAQLGRAVEDRAAVNATERDAKHMRPLHSDANGNMTSEGNRTFTYDPINRLSSITDNGIETASYAYDARNLRTKKTTSAGTTLYHYDSQGHLIAETDTSGTTLVEYIYLNDTPLAMVLPANTVHYYHTDHLGTPRVMTNASGTISRKALHNAYGYAEVDASSTITNNIRFPGQYYDQESGYHYNGNRYYDPRTGRYITADPIGLEGGINPYVYVDDAPVNNVDPWGLCGMTDVMDWAGAKRGSWDYSYGAHHSEARGRAGYCLGGYGAPKCNLFVYDALKQGNCAPQRMPDGRVPGACELADPNVTIGNCPVLKPGEQPQSGDIVALRNNNGTCHVGLYSPKIDKSGNTIRMTISARAYWNIVHNDWGFRPNDQPTIRRCKCSCQ